jgi:hypothetical protein
MRGRSIDVSISELQPYQALLAKGSRVTDAKLVSELNKRPNTRKTSSLEAKLIIETIRDVAETRGIPEHYLSVELLKNVGAIPYTMGSRIEALLGLIFSRLSDNDRVILVNTHAKVLQQAFPETSAGRCRALVREDGECSEVRNNIIDFLCRKGDLLLFAELFRKIDFKLRIILKGSAVNFEMPSGEPESLIAVGKVNAEKILNLFREIGLGDIVADESPVSSPPKQDLSVLFRRAAIILAREEYTPERIAALLAEDAPKFIATALDLKKPPKADDLYRANLTEYENLVKLLKGRGFTGKEAKLVLRPPTDPA